MRKKAYLAGIDIGTTKLVAIMGEIVDDSNIEIIGFNKQPSPGVKMGELVNVEDTVELLKKAIDEVERFTNISMQHVTVNISGNHIKSENHKEGISISRGREVRDSDIERVLDVVKGKISHNLKRYLLHTLVSQYILDGQDGIMNPKGMIGHHLEVEAHVITADSNKVENLMRCIQLTGVQVDEFVASSVASAEAVLTEDEKALGVILVDIGGGTWDISIFCEGAVRYTGVISLGSECITRDISKTLNVPLAEAEEIKKKYGSCIPDELEDEPVEVTLLGGMQKKVFSKLRICEIIEARVEETFKILRQLIHDAGYEGTTSAGIVLTGGGALLKDIDKFAERALDMRARIGIPNRVSGLKSCINEPEYATSIGTLLYSLKRRKDLHSHGGGMIHSLKRFIKRHF